MTNFLHWHKTTWILVLWSAYIATWTLVTGPRPAIVAVWWLAGLIVFGQLLLATQAPFRQGRQSRMANLHRTYRLPRSPRDAS